MKLCGNKKKPPDYSKLVARDNRALLWILTIGGLLLAFYCAYRGFTGSLPWIAGMESAVWAADATVKAFYMRLATSDHKEGGITFEAAKAQNFGVDTSQDSVSI